MAIRTLLDAAQWVFEVRRWGGEVFVLSVVPSLAPMAATFGDVYLGVFALRYSLASLLRAATRSLASSESFLVNLGYLAMPSRSCSAAPMEALSKA